VGKEESESIAMGHLERDTAKYSYFFPFHQKMETVLISEKL
jgi:hypothetical protein